MRYTADNRVFNLILLLTIAGEFIVPLILERACPGYDGMTSVMSALGSPESPVRVIYNIWLVWLGVLLAFTAAVYYLSLRERFPAAALLMLFSIGIFAVGAGIISGLFSVNESKDTVTAASRIHGVCAAVGFMALLFFPLLSGIVSLRQKDIAGDIIGICAFVFALVSFACFIMGDKEQFKNTFLKYEGLFERLTLFFMYVPFIYNAVCALKG